MKEFKQRINGKFYIENSIREFDFTNQSKEGLYRIVLQAIEKPLIETVLERTCGNQLKAARILGINRNTLRTKIKKLGIELNRWKR